MNPLHKIHARSLMSSHVLQLSPDLPVPRALELFEDHKISGAPVVDANGRVLGVLSASDVTQAERLGRSAARAQTPALVMRDGDDESDDELAEEDLLSIEAEIRRVLNAYQLAQSQRLSRETIQYGGKNTFSSGEVLRTVNDVDIKQLGDVAVANLQITTAAGSLLNFNQPLG